MIMRARSALLSCLPCKTKNPCGGRAAAVPTPDNKRSGGEAFALFGRGER